MAKEIKIHEIIRQAGYEPVENRAIIVRYAPANLSDRIAHFFGVPYYVLQICKSALVLLPLSSITTNPQNEITLALPVSEIQSVTVTEELLDYRIELKTEEGTIALSTQQKELSMLRSSGFLGAEDAAGIQNWHCRNLEDTLTGLKKISQQEPV